MWIVPPTGMSPLAITTSPEIRIGSLYNAILWGSGTNKHECGYPQARGAERERETLVVQIKSNSLVSIVGSIEISHKKLILRNALSDQTFRFSYSR